VIATVKIVARPRPAVRHRDHVETAGAVIDKDIGRHSGAMQSIEPGISRFPDVQLHI
jgi:hypothetical protein